MISESSRSACAEVTSRQWSSSHSTSSSSIANSGGDVMQNAPPPACWLSTTRPAVYIWWSPVEVAVEGEAPSECLRTETSDEKMTNLQWESEFKEIFNAKPH